MTYMPRKASETLDHFEVRMSLPKLEGTLKQIEIAKMIRWDTIMIHLPKYQNVHMLPNEQEQHILRICRLITSAAAWLEASKSNPGSPWNYLLKVASLLTAREYPNKKGYPAPILDLIEECPV